MSGGFQGCHPRGSLSNLSSAGTSRSSEASFADHFLSGKPPAVRQLLLNRFDFLDGPVAGSGYRPYRHPGGGLRLSAVVTDPRLRLVGEVCE